MNRKGQFDFDFGPEMIFAAIGGIIAGFIALIVMKGSGAGFFWKIVTFAVTVVVGGGVTWFILNKE